ncbi:unnamed protein product [Hymenolepis diminuta]|uniref:Uncharacterized protein n=1 Tax=Hymenolepis diminuta TaxID=6216 RepID=A0A564YP01_HYMDI|nr:unnamed protein product [Hymenolepis diminuta]
MRDGGDNAEAQEAVNDSSHLEKDACEGMSADVLLTETGQLQEKGESINSS